MALSDILVTPASVWYAPVGEALPNINTVAAGAAWGGNWKNLGMTLEPVSANYSTTTFELEAQQSTAPVKRVRERETLVIETVLAEFTGDNLKLVTDGTVTTQAAGPAAVGAETIKAGGKVDLTYYQWGFEGVWVTDAGARLPVRIFVYRGDAVLNGALAFAKNAGVGIPLQIRAIADTAKTAGQQLMEIHNVTAPKTA